VVEPLSRDRHVRRRCHPGELAPSYQRGGHAGTPATRASGPPRGLTAHRRGGTIRCIGDTRF